MVNHYYVMIHKYAFCLASTVVWYKAPSFKIHKYRFMFQKHACPKGLTSRNVFAYKHSVVLREYHVGHSL